MRKFIYSFFTGCIAVCVLFCGGCFGGKLAWADATYTKMGGISAKVVDGENKKAFVLGADDERRIAEFGELGEIPQINVLVKGNITIQGLRENTTAMTGERGASHVTGNNETPSYYTDWIKIKIKLPSDRAVKIDKLDGNGPTLIDKAQSIEDGYYYEKVEYIIGDGNKENFHVVSDIDEGEDYYMYYGFCDENNEIISEYFVRVQYEVTIQ